MKTINSIALMLIIIVIYFVGAYVHEYQHQQTYLDYGIKSNIMISSEGLSTVSEKYDLSPEDRRALILSQENLDNNTYSQFINYWLLTFILVILFIKNEDLIERIIKGK
jgi:hypothetical protein